MTVMIYAGTSNGAQDWQSLKFKFQNQISILDKKNDKYSSFFGKHVYRIEKKNHFVCSDSSQPAKTQT